MFGLNSHMTKHNRETERKRKKEKKMKNLIEKKLSAKPNRKKEYNVIDMY